MQIMHLIFKLADSLRSQGLYNEAISEYARLGPIVNKVLVVHIQKLLRFGLFIVTSNFASMRRQQLRMLDTEIMLVRLSMLLCRQLRNWMENPPARQTNEYSLYN